MDIKKRKNWRISSNRFRDDNSFFIKQIGVCVESIDAGYRLLDGFRFVGYTECSRLGVLGEHYNRNMKFAIMVEYKGEDCWFHSCESVLNSLIRRIKTCSQQTVQGKI